MTLLSTTMKKIVSKTTTEVTVMNKNKYDHPNCKHFSLISNRQFKKHGSFTCTLYKTNTNIDRCKSVKCEHLGKIKSEFASELANKIMEKKLGARLEAQDGKPTDRARIKVKRISK